MMKLRIRSLETKETTRIEIANSSTLLELKTLIAGKLSSSSSISPQSITLSLNRKDELVSSSAADSLQSLGLAAGDLLFYSQTLALTAGFESGSGSNSPPILMEKSTETPAPSSKRPNLGTVNESKSDSPNPKVAGDSSKTLDSDPNQDIIIIERADFESKDNRNETLACGSDLMEVEAPWMEKPPSVPYILKRVMDLEKEEIKGNLGFLIVAVHAVFLESGFVACDDNDNGSRLPKDWNLVTAVISIQYTVPDLLGHSQERDVKVASLKFSVMRNQVAVYGYLSGEPDVYRLCLDLSKVVPLLVFLSEGVSREEEKEIFKFWKTVKDGLCLPLLIDICEKNGKPSPPCFARLPTDLKIKVMELLPGVDVAKVGCTGTELRYLALNDEIWKQKFSEEFGMVIDREVAAISSWREKYKLLWVKKRDANNNTRRALSESRYGNRRVFMPRYPPFAPQRSPFIVGGDYDRFPAAIGGVGLMGPGLGFPRYPTRRNLLPHCNLGGHNDDFCNDDFMM